MPAEQYDKAIDTALDENNKEDSYSNPKEGDSGFNKYNDPIQASIAYLTAYFYEKFLKREFNEQSTRSKISMSDRCLILTGPQYENEDDILISATHAERPKGISREILAKVLQVSVE